MFRRRNRFILTGRDREDMRPEMESMFDAMSPTGRGGFRVDVRDQDGEVIVTADLPYVDKASVSLQLLNPRLLEIVCRRDQDDSEADYEGYFIRDRISGLIRRAVVLPADVTEDGANIIFKNGILEVRLKEKIMPQ